MEVSRNLTLPSEDSGSSSEEKVGGKGRDLLVLEVSNYFGQIKRFVVVFFTVRCFCSKQESSVNPLGITIPKRCLFWGFVGIWERAGRLPPPVDLSGEFFGAELQFFFCHSGR